MSNGDSILGHVKSGQVPEKSIYLYHLADEIFTAFSGERSSNHISFSFTFESFNVNQHYIGTILSEVYIPMVMATIDVGFDAGFVQVGTDENHALILSEDNLRMGKVSTYQTFPHVEMMADTNIYLFTGGAPTQGSGLLTVCLA